MKSSEIEGLFARYQNLSPGELSPIEQNRLKTELDSIKSINNKSDAEVFLRLLSLVRESEAMAIDGLGPDALSTIVGAFAGGDEGVYAADTDQMNARFIFELVQNVDDCKYKDATNSKLDIKFNLNNDTIILRYNEVGFQPENVIAITGLGNSTKNHKKAQNRKSEEALDQSDLQEIGEKGIGFKSIFGLAREVRIKSQYFFFSIERENFFVPVIGDYSQFEYTDYTELELKLDDGLVKELYGFLKNKYDQDEAIINENPILFLNKLTQIEYYASEDDYFGFSVSRKDNTEDVYRESTTIEFYSSDSSRNRSIEAYRFTRNIEYSIKECQSRYGIQESSTRKHKIIVIAPKKADLIKKGRIYSFFATSEVINAPFIIHAPFKLNSGRTKIDQQSQSVESKNAWFIRTREESLYMIHEVYEALPHLIGSEIINYVPESFLFDRGTAIFSHYTSRENILTWKILPCIDGKCVSLHVACVINYKASKEQLRRIYEITGIPRELLDVEYDKIEKFKMLGVYCVNDVEKQLLLKALEDSTLTEECLSYLQDYAPDNSDRIIKNYALNENQVVNISKYHGIIEWINIITVSNIKDPKTCSIAFSDNKKATTVDKIIDFCEDHQEGIDEGFVQYVKKARFYQIKLDNPIFLNNCVFGYNILEDFASLYHMLRPKDKLLFPLLSIEGVSEKIDLLCQKGDEISDYDFLSQLAEYRKTQKKVLGEQYQSVLDLIEKSGTDTERFFPEILQNIDDCSYVEEPHVRIRIDNVNGDNKLRVEYNESGFTREQIRAITAIGDSTKKKLLNSHTGEKGVGFKSVFSICKEVLIESGSLQFTLTNEKPTIPSKIKKIRKTGGTSMVYTLDSRFTKRINDLLSSEVSMLKYLLCMKQVKSFVINQRTITIKNGLNKRTIMYDGRLHEFFCFRYPIIINSQQALHQRRKSKNVDPRQDIYYIVPFGDYLRQYRVYSTFPTQEEISIPMIIDMPLELDTARERASNTSWNDAVLCKVGDGLLEVYHQLKYHFGIKIASFIPKPDFRLIATKYFVSSEIMKKIPKMNILKLAFAYEFT